MADKKPTAAEKKAAAEAAAQAEAARKEMERRRLLGAGAVLAAIALFVGGYAIGNASGDDSLVGANLAIDERPGPFGGHGDEHPGPGGGFDFNLPEDFPFLGGPGHEGDRGDRFPGPGRGFEFDVPEGFPFPPEGFDVPRGPYSDEGREGFGFGLECTPKGDQRGDFHCELTLPQGFDFPRGPFFDDEVPPQPAPHENEVPAEPGFLGVAVIEGPDGVQVTEVFPGSAADEVGIEPGDVLVAVNGEPIDSVDTLAGLVSDAGAGTLVEVVVDRDGEEIVFDVILGAQF